MASTTTAILKSYCPNLATTTQLAMVVLLATANSLAAQPDRQDAGEAWN